MASTCFIATFLVFFAFLGCILADDFESDICGHNVFEESPYPNQPYGYDRPSEFVYLRKPADHEKAYNIFKPGFVYLGRD